MKVCPKCNHANNEEFGFCEFCGTDLNIEYVEDEVGEVVIKPKKNWFKYFLIIFTLIFSIVMFGLVFAPLYSDLIFIGDVGQVKIKGTIIEIISLMINVKTKDALFYATGTTLVVTLILVLINSFIGIITSIFSLTKKEPDKFLIINVITTLILTMLIAVVYGFNGALPGIYNFSLFVLVVVYLIYLLTSDPSLYKENKIRLFMIGAFFSALISFSLTLANHYVEYVPSLNMNLYGRGIFAFIYFYNSQAFSLVFIPAIVTLIVSLIAAYLIIKKKCLLASFIGYVSTFIAITILITSHIFNIKSGGTIAYLIFSLIYSSLALIYYLLDKQKLEKNGTNK